MADDDEGDRPGLITPTHDETAPHRGHTLIAPLAMQPSAVE